jgi:hypothetical protein
MADRVRQPRLVRHGVSGGGSISLRTSGRNRVTQADQTELQPVTLITTLYRTDHPPLTPEAMVLIVRRRQRPSPPHLPHRADVSDSGPVSHALLPQSGALSAGVLPQTQSSAHRHPLPRGGVEPAVSVQLCRCAAVPLCRCSACFAFGLLLRVRTLNYGHDRR